MRELSLDSLLADRLSVTFDDDVPSERLTMRPGTMPDLVTTIATATARGGIVRPDSHWSSDWTTNSGGDAVLLTDDLALPPVEWIDWERAVARVRGGALIGDVTAELIANGWCPHALAAVAGMTVGAAIGANAATANGSGGRFGQGVLAIDIVDGNGAVSRIDPIGHRDAFLATIGGLGLTGVVVAAELRIRAVHTAWMLVDSQRADRFSDVLTTLESNAAIPSYALLDGSAVGSECGRGQVFRARHAKVADLPSARTQEALRYEPVSTDVRPRRILPNSRTVRHLQRYRHRTAAPEQVGTLQTIPQFFASATIGLPEQSPWWLRYESEIPSESVSVIPELLAELAHREIPCERFVLSRMTIDGAGLLNSMAHGWRFGFGIPVDHPSTARTLDEFDELVLACGGQSIISSDERLRPELLAPMVTGLDSWRIQRARLDPDQRFQSDLSRRLQL